MPVELDERLEQIRNREEAAKRIWTPVPDEWLEPGVTQRIICTAVYAWEHRDGTVRATCILVADRLEDERLMLTVWPWWKSEPVATADELLALVEKAVS